MVADPDPDRFVGFANAELVGAGGLGRVFQATRISTGGAVAIKELTASPGSPLEHRARRELEAMLRLKGHPNIVSVEEIFEGPNGPCLVMELLSGGTLSDRLAEGSLDPVEIRLVVEHVTAALETAHAAQIVHRDIKPANLMYGRFGQVKVLDFGIAALVRGGEVTQTGAFTLAYASPEELDGERRIGPPADVYSLSATLLHVMTGSPPSFRDRMAGRADLARIDPRLSALGAVVEAGLRHSPADRPSLAEFRRAVEGIGVAAAPTEQIAAQTTHGASVSAGVAPGSDAHRAETQHGLGATSRAPESTGEPSRARALVVGAAVLLVVLGVAGAAWLVLGGRSDADEPSRALDDPFTSEAAPSSLGEASTATATATTLTPATTDPPVPETVIVTVLVETPPETNAPLPETVVVTVLVEGTTSTPPAPTPTPPDPVVQGVSEARASDFVGAYLRSADSGDFATAWAMLSPAEQAGYSRGLDSFAEFWRSRVLLAGPASPQMDSLGVDDGVALFETVLWYDVCNAGTGQVERSTERVRIGLIADDDDLLIETYDFIELVESPEIGACP